MAVFSTTALNSVSPVTETTSETAFFSGRAVVWGISHSRRGAAASLVLLGLNGWGLLRQWLAPERD